MDWKKKFVCDIRLRNILQTGRFEEIFKKYGALHSEFDILKSELEERNKDFRKRISTSIQIKQLSSEESEDYVKRISELNDQVHGLNEELRLSYRTNVSRGEEIMAQKEELKKVTEKFGLHVKELENEKFRNRELESRIDDLEKTVESKNSTIEILKNTKVVLTEKCDNFKKIHDDLNKDYQSLLDRILSEKQKLIEKMNENNELQTQLEKKMIELENLKKKYRVQSKTSPGNIKRSRGSGRVEEDEIDQLMLEPPAGVEQKIQIGTAANSVHFSPSGQFFAAACDDCSVKIFSLSTRKLMNSYTYGSGKESILRVRFSPNNDLILGTSTDSSIRVWNLRERKLKLTLTGHSKRVFAADFSSRDIRRLATGSHDRTIKIWDLNRGSMLKTILAQSSCNDLEISSSSIIFSAHFDKSIRIYDIRNYGLIMELKDIHDSQITSVNVSSNGKYILSAGRDSFLKVFDFRKKQRLAILNNTDNYRNSVNYSKAVFSPCGTFAAAGSHNGKLVIWNIAKQETHKIYGKGHTSVINGVDWNSLGDKLISCSNDKSLVLWN